MHTSLMKFKASSLEVIVFHRVDQITLSSPAHNMKSSTSVVLNGRRVMVNSWLVLEEVVVGIVTKVTD